MEEIVKRLLLWFVHHGHRPALSRLLARLSPLAGRPWFPPLAGLMAFAATLSMSIPTVPLLITLVVFAPRRWLPIGLWASLGSATAGALLVHLLGHWGSAYLAEKLPELVTSAHWNHMTDWTSHHGWWLLMLIAVSPISQTPILIVAAMIGMPASTVFSSLFMGKVVKYSVMAGLTAKAADRMSAGYGWQSASPE